MSTLSRRDVIRYAAAATAVAGGVAGAQALSTSGSSAQVPAGAAAPADPRDFELEYRGKKIKGVHGGGAHGAQLSARGTSRSRQPHQVHIDGRKLAVMQIELPSPSGTGVVLGFISALNHYEPVLIDEDKNRDGLLKLARRAVDVLGNSELTALAGADHNHGN
ncbi:tyrosinase family oxidase copper chaperone [Actinoplanes oblitus]|uniref:Tyrosinase family oxidase copper chaperone n=1 Tax=Actinoplanes oblitus TaxID=3040509 RepID=A0ABY8WNK2_9ACTN|nr:tyrosinase family oxidase copper chaperone [Actinoplanes oblitus]WIM98611.1 tyrosinase family oxidase copper chaperone [Actinoplanes oblitus]